MLIPSSFFSSVAAPLVSINLFPFSSRNITIGQNITVQCAISTDYGRPTDIDVIPRILWEVSYENNGERVINSFEATGLTVLTPAVFLASLDYAPVISARNFTCRSYVQPMLPNLRILTSETASDSRIVSPQGKGYCSVTHFSLSLSLLVYSTYTFAIVVFSQYCFCLSSLFLHQLLHCW